MNALNQLFLANLKILLRDRAGFFWTIVIPVLLYIAVSVLPIGKLFNTSEKYSTFLLPGIIAMAIMQGGIYGLAYWMTDMKALGVLKRFLVTPLKTWQLLMGVVGARLVITFIQVIVLTLVGALFFHATFTWNIISSFILILLGGSIFLLIGLLISNYATSYSSAAPLTAAVALPMTFLSSIFYPLTIFPHPLQILARMLPATYLADGLRQAYLYPFNIEIISKDIFILAIWLLAIILIAISVFRLKAD